MDAEGSSEEDEDFDAAGEAAEDAAAEAEAEAEAAMDGSELDSPVKVCVFRISATYRFKWQRSRRGCRRG